MRELRPVAVETRRVDPDPSITSAIGRRHSLESAVADLLDNSIDAHSHSVLVRILRRDERAVGLFVIDDGDGMDSSQIDRAMGYAHRREYGAADLGHFGIGMKAASLSQADTLYVWSRRAGAPAVGRGLERSTLDEGPEVQTFSTDDASARLAEVDPGFLMETGTVVEWRDVRGFLQSPDSDEQRDWLERALERLRTHLGLVLHRILALGQVTIRLDVLDEDHPEFGTVPRAVAPLDPFGYRRSGAFEYPQELTFALPDGIAGAVLHLWPSEPGNPNWMLGGRTPLETQGLYAYRNDRLLQAGGWNGLTNPSRDLVHARVALDIDAVLARHVTIDPEKTGVAFDAVITGAWSAGRLASGGAFAEYLAVARLGARASRKRNPSPVQVAEPGKGFSEAVSEAIADNATFTPAGDPVNIRWKYLGDDEVLRVDRDNGTVWLNHRYRTALGGASGLRDDDAQVVKVLVHLLIGSHAAGGHSGAKEKRDEAAWHAMLLAAVRDEDRRRAEDERPFAEGDHR